MIHVQKTKKLFASKPLLTTAPEVLCRRRGNIEMPISFRTRKSAEDAAAEHEGARVERCRPGFPSKNWFVVRG